MNACAARLEGQLLSARMLMYFQIATALEMSVAKYGLTNHKCQVSAVF
jgi:hypothetical protein